MKKLVLLCSLVATLAGCSVAEDQYNFVGLDRCSQFAEHRDGSAVYSIWVDGAGLPVVFKFGTAEVQSGRCDDR